MQVIIRDEQGLAVKVYPEQYIPTYAELLEAIQNELNIEIKGESKCQS